MQAKQLHK